jgi:hypothetical protein
MADIASSILRWVLVSKRGIAAMIVLLWIIGFGDTLPSYFGVTATFLLAQSPSVQFMNRGRMDTIKDVVVMGRLGERGNERFQ